MKTLTPPLKWHGGKHYLASRIIALAPTHVHAEQEFKEAEKRHNYAGVDRAIAFFIKCRQSLAGRMDSFAPLSRTRTRRGMNEQASAWLNAIEGLPAVHN